MVFLDMYPTQISQESSGDSIFERVYPPGPLLLASPKILSFVGNVL